ncbi:hypothetical protein [Campylobacter ornithocola]|uniref:putative barnase/colicin E5 family endoribonuclease n=1 Tax=Campylobacter ornithocola TaxID=1848766 RepID=UPI001FE442B5|nr:hypothetical protein [Campylobacter ornithocola]
MEEYKGTEKEKTNFKHLKKEQKVIEEYREEIEQIANIKPLKEFGKNYAEYYHDGKGALQKLLIEKQGQVAGAFHRKDLGDIDLVWGDGNFGLSHIINKRSKQWNSEKAIKFISHLDENIKNGKLVEVEKGRIAIKTQLTTIILDKKGNNKFVITAFRDRNNKDL